MPLLFLALSGSTLVRSWRVTAIPAAAATVAALSLYAGGLILSYHVPCGSTYYRLDLCYQPVYKNWAPDERYSPPVSTELTLAQEIVPECSGMTEVRVWVNAAGADPSDSARFTLYDPHLDRVLADKPVLAGSLPAGDWYSFDFDPEWDSSGRLYVLTIQSENPSDERGVTISYSLRPEYTAGKLFENEEAVSHDMIFQYGCLAGLQQFLRGSP